MFTTVPSYQSRRLFYYTEHGSQFFVLFVLLTKSCQRVVGCVVWKKKNLVQRENCVLNLITKNRRFSLSIFRCAVPSHAAVSKCVKKSDKSYCFTRELNVSLADNKASVIAAPEIPCQCRRRYSLSLPLRYSRKQPPTIF